MSEESHLRHKISQLEELKDAFLAREINEEEYLKKARPLAKEIRELQAKEKEPNGV